MISVHDQLINELEAKHSKEFERISASMIATFSTETGRVAYEAIMTTLRMFREATTEEDRHLQNAGKRIQYLMGAGREVDRVTADLEIAKKAQLRRTAKRRGK